MLAVSVAYVREYIRQQQKRRNRLDYSRLPELVLQVLPEAKNNGLLAELTAPAPFGAEESVKVLPLIRMPSTLRPDQQPVNHPQAVVPDESTSVA